MGPNIRSPKKGIKVSQVHFLKVSQVHFLVILNSLNLKIFPVMVEDT